MFIKIVFFLFMFTNILYAQAQDVIPEIPCVKTELKNGLVLLVSPDTKVPSVSIQVFVRAGSAYEGELIGSGVSHFVEHMLFESSSSFAQSDLATQIMQAGGVTNAYTSLEKTVYYIDMPGKNYKQGLELINKALFESEIKEEAFQKEKKIILFEGKNVQDRIENRLQEKFLKLIYPNTPYAVPVLGYPDQIEKLTCQEIQNYYKKKYAPNNMILSICGNVDVQEVQEYVKQLFGKQKRGNISFFEKVDVFENSKEKNIKSSEDDIASEHIILGFKTGGYYSKDLARIMLLSLILGEGKSSALFKILKIEKNMVYDIQSFYLPFIYSGVFEIVSKCETQAAEDVRKEILNVIKQISDKGCTEEELVSAKKRLVSDYIFGLEKLHGRADLLAMCELLFQDPFYYQSFLKEVYSVSSEDIKLVANKIFRDERRYEILAEPQTKEKQLSKKSDQAAVALPNIKMFSLKNGIQCVVIEKKGMPIVNIRAGFIGGVLFENKKNNGVSYLLSKMLAYSTEKRSQYELASYIESKGGDFSSYSSNNSLGVVIQMLSSDLKEGLDILCEIIKSPNFNLKILNNVKKDALSFIEEQTLDPFNVALLNARKIFFNNHPYAFNYYGTKENIIALSLKDVKEFYKKVICPKNMVICITGDVDFDKTKDFTEKIFEKIDIKGEAPEPPRINIKNKDEKIIKVELPKEQSAVMLVYPSCKVKDKDRFALELIGSMLGDTTGMLFSEIRKKQGNAYFVNSMNISGIEPGCFVMGVFTDKKHINGIIDTVKESVDKIRKGQFEDAFVDMAKKNLLSQYDASLESASQLGMNILLDVLYGVGIKSFLCYKETITSITKDDIIKISKKYFDEDLMKISIVEGQK